MITPADYLELSNVSATASSKSNAHEATSSSRQSSQAQTSKPPPCPLDICSPCKAPEDTTSYPSFHEQDSSFSALSASGRACQPVQKLNFDKGTREKRKKQNKYSFFESVTKRRSKFRSPIHDKDNSNKADTPGLAFIEQSSIILQKKQIKFFMKRSHLKKGCST